MYNAMDLSDIQVLSPSRSRTHKAFFQNNIYSHSNYRTNKRRNFIDMDILDYPSFGSYFCPYENRGTDNKKYFIKFSSYDTELPSSKHNVKLSYELKNGNEEIHKTSYFLIYIFLNESHECLRFSIDLDSITKISLGENNFEDVKKNPYKKREQTLYFYLKYPPKIDHKRVNEAFNNSESNENEENNSSFPTNSNEKENDENLFNINLNEEDQNQENNFNKKINLNNNKINEENVDELNSNKDDNENEFKIINNDDNINNNTTKEINKNFSLNDINNSDLSKNTKNEKSCDNINIIESFKSEENLKEKDNQKIKSNEANDDNNVNKTEDSLKLNNINKDLNKNYINHDNEFFFNKFKTVFEKYEYKNHNHYEDGIISICNNEEIDKNKESFTSRKEIKRYDSSGFVRLDSFLSKKNEYLNFYILNLIMKIKIKFSSQEEFVNLFYDKLKLKEKIISLENKNFILYEPSQTIFEQAKNLLSQCNETFYLNLVKLHFSLQYSILSFITTRKLNLFNYTFFHKIMRGFSKLSCKEQDIMSKALDQLTNEAQLNNDLGTVIGSRYNDLKTQIENNENSKNEINSEIKDNISYMRTIEITPSIIYYEVPKLERNNQIIRKFKKYQEHFIKISINDEDHNKIYFASSRNIKLLEIPQSLMMNGVNIGTHHFKYLTSSNSQAKQGNGWYFNLEFTKFKNIDEVLREMGDFNDEHNKYKNASRRGQCASSTTPINFLQKENIIEIPDIKSSDQKYIYTDGIGTISYDLALKCVEKIGNNKFLYCSAFQIRLLGIKGVVAVDPHLGNKDIICIRPSMKKYESENNELGIIKASGYSTGYLNRQIITLLSGLGVKNYIFTNMIKVSLKEYQTILNYIKSKNTDLSSYFRANKDVYNEVLSKCFYFKTLVDYYLYKKSPRSLINEPFIQKILLNCLALKIRDLKSKGKIMDKQSASLMGVIDETGTLKHNEVFVRIIKPFSRKEEQDFTLEGEVYVTKNPCLHPGDIKILKAVNNEVVYKNLSHMINVIVFSSLDDENDKRPIQNQISGGDLDGDIYYVSWNKDIIDGITKRNVPPQDDPKYTYSNLNKTDENITGIINSNIVLDKTISMNDVILSHINTMKNDLVPLISNLYLAHADNDLVNGPFNEKCKMLSNLFIIAIDSQKNGKFINQDILKEKGLLLKKYPDFLETDSFNIYPSQGILGILYRFCNEKEFLDEFDYYEYQSSYNFSYYLDVELFDSKCLPYTHEMLKIYIKYETELKALMQKYNFSDEVSFFLNVDIRNSKNNKKIREVPPFKEIELLQKKYKNKIIDTFGKDITKPIACACYLVTYMNLHMEKGNPKLFKEDKEGKLFVEEWKNYYLYKVIGKEYDSYDSYKERTKGFEMGVLKNKKIFSLPWIIKEIREVLFTIGSYSHDKYGYFYEKEDKKNYYGYNKKYKGKNYRYNYINK